MTAEIQREPAAIVISDRRWTSTQSKKPLCYLSRLHFFSRSAASAMSAVVPA